MSLFGLDFLQNQDPALQREHVYIFPLFAHAARPDIPCRVFSLFCLFGFVFHTNLLGCSMASQKSCNSGSMVQLPDSKRKLEGAGPPRGTRMGKYLSNDISR